MPEEEEMVKACFEVTPDAGIGIDRAFSWFFSQNHWLQYWQIKDALHLPGKNDRSGNEIMDYVPMG